MSDIKWIKVMTDMFDNRKIKQIEKLPEGDSIIVIWLKLLCLAGNVNEQGLIYFTKEIPYTEEMMATEFNRPVNTVRLALKTFEEFQMIEIIDNIIMVSNWEKYQNTDGLDKVREQTRKRVAKHREMKKLLLAQNSNVTSNVTVTESNATEREEEKEKDLSFSNKEKDKRKKQPKADSLAPDIQAIIDAYYMHCPSYPKLRCFKDDRIKPLKKLLKQYAYSDFVEVFKKMESSDFLKGAKGFKASFDWVIKESNFIKVLEGNYDNVDSKQSKNQFNNFNQRDYDLSELEKLKFGGAGCG